jgi:hypothetical protein
MNKKKLDQVAKNYIEAHNRYMLWNCCDSMRDLDRYEAQWSILTDDKIEIKKYIKDNLFEFYQKALVEAIEEEWDGEMTFEEVIAQGAGEVLFPYEPKKK